MYSLEPRRSNEQIHTRLDGITRRIDKVFEFLKNDEEKLLTLDVELQEIKKCVQALPDNSFPSSKGALLDYFPGSSGTQSFEWSRQPERNKIQHLETAINQSAKQIDQLEKKQEGLKNQMQTQLTQMNVQLNSVQQQHANWRIDVGKKLKDSVTISDHEKKQQSHKSTHDDLSRDIKNRVCASEYVQRQGQLDESINELKSSINSLEKRTGNQAALLSVELEKLKEALKREEEHSQNENKEIMQQISIIREKQDASWTSWLALLLCTLNPFEYQAPPKKPKNQ